MFPTFGGGESDLKILADCSVKKSIPTMTSNSLKHTSLLSPLENSELGI